MHNTIDDETIKGMSFYLRVINMHDGRDVIGYINTDLGFEYILMDSLEFALQKRDDGIYYQVSPFNIHTESSFVYIDANDVRCISPANSYAASAYSEYFKKLMGGLSTPDKASLH